jgi:hypothetical protein
LTSNHIFYIPAIFFLGLFAGIIFSGFTAGDGKVAHPTDENLKIGGRTLFAAFGVFASIFIITHLFNFPGGMKALRTSMNYQPIFDTQSATSAEEVYSRIENFGEAGRQSYMTFTYTADLIFPLSFLLLLALLAKFTAERTTLSRSQRRALVLLPFLWFSSDVVENAIVFTLLSSYPAKNIFLMTALGPVTTAKFILLLASIALPPVALVSFRQKKG